MNNILDVTFSKEMEAVSGGLTQVEETNLLTIAKTGTGDARTRARNKLLESQLKQIVKVARSYSNNLNSVQELVSVGAIGFDHAIDKFDMTAGVRFVTYYLWWVRDHINREVHENHTIRPPMNIAKTNSKTDEELDNMANSNKRKKEDKIRIGFSINAPTSDDGKTTYEDTLQSSETLEDDLHNKFLIRKALKGLNRNSREWRIIKYHHIDGMTLETIGEIFGVTKQYISIIMIRELARIKKRIEL